MRSVLRGSKEPCFFIFSYIQQIDQSGLSYLGSLTHHLGNKWTGASSRVQPKWNSHPLIIQSCPTLGLISFKVTAYDLLTFSSGFWKHAPFVSVAPAVEGQPSELHSVVEGRAQGLGPHHLFCLQSFDALDHQLALWKLFHFIFSRQYGLWIHAHLGLAIIY